MKSSATTASTSRSSRMATVSRRASDAQSSRLKRDLSGLGRRVGGSAMEVHTLTVQHGPKRRQAGGVPGCPVGSTHPRAARRGATPWPPCVARADRPPNGGPARQPPIPMCRPTVTQCRRTGRPRRRVAGVRGSRSRERIDSVVTGQFTVGNHAPQAGTGGAVADTEQRGDPDELPHREVRLVDRPTEQSRAQTAHSVSGRRSESATRARD